MKKTWALVLSLMLLLGIFAACGEGGGTTGTTGGTTAASQGGTTQGTTAATTGTPAEPEKVVFLIREEWETDLPGEQDVVDKIAQETGIEVSWVKPPAGTYEETLSIMLASGEQLDAFIAFGTWTDLASKGYIAPLSDLLNEYGKNILATQPESDFAPLTDQKSGQIMALPFGNTRLGNAPRVRKDWLDELGMEVPTTLEDFEAVLKAFKETDKFGQNAVPLITSFQFNQLDRAFAGMWIETGDNNFIDTDGKVKECVFEPGYKDYIAKMAEWYKLGYIWPESFIQEFTVINDIVAQDRVGVMGTWVSVGLNGYETLHTVNPKAEYVYLDTLNGPKGSAYSLRPASAQGIVLSAKSEKKETVIRLYDWLATDNNTVTAYSGVEGLHYNWADKENRIIEKTEMGEKFKGIDTLFFGYGQTTYDATFLSSLWKLQADFEANPALDLKVGDDYGIVYDEAKIDASVPSVVDLRTTRDGEIVKFIMGQRSMDEWDAFINELLGMGFDKVIEERTAQYNALKK